jgi:hypothetical protein
MTNQNKLVTDGLLIELAKEEVALIEADAELQYAQAKFDVASRKYAAVRDMVTAHLGKSPYSKGDVKWPSQALTMITNKFKPFGLYRFLHMKTGDATVDVLKEAKEPLTLEEIVEKVRAGGIRKSETFLIRAINAALMRTKGVEKTKDGKYKYKEPEPADIPF